MAVSIERQEAGVFQVIWSGHITIEEVFRGMEALVGAIDQHNDHRAVAIMDFTETTQIPFEIAHWRRLVECDARIIAFVFVHAETAAQVLARMLASMTKRPIEWVATRAEAEDSAYDMLGDITKVSPMAFRRALLQRLQTPK